MQNYIERIYELQSFEKSFYFFLVYFPLFDTWQH